MKKLKCRQILLVTKHEQTHQVVDRVIREHKFHTDFIGKDAWMSQ